MAYSQLGLIEASDYNNFLNGSNQLNTVWSTGTGNAGYGQTALSTVSQLGMVMATQWATLINTLNSTLTHQSASGSGISATTAGNTIFYLSTLASSINTAYTNRNNFASQGTTTTGATFSPNYTSGTTQSALTWTFTRTITFASADQARYFFNCGGQLNLVTISVVNNDGTSRSGDWVTVIGTEFSGISAIRQGSNGGRSGSGGTVNTNNTALGYYSLTTSAQTISQITSTTSGYTGDYIICGIRSSGTSGANGDKGNVVYLDFTVYSAARAALPTPGGSATNPSLTVTNTSVNDSINVTWNHRIDIVYPETTNLTNTWGTVTIS